MILLNFTFAITVQQKKQIQTLLGLSDLRVREVHYTFSYEEPFVPQAKDALNAMGLTRDELENEDFVVMLQSHPAAAVATVLEVERQTGKVPLCVRLKRVSVRPARFEVAEIMRHEQGGA